MWATADVLSNPTQGDVLADSGAILLGGAIDFTIVLWGENAGALVEFVQRNAANDDNVQPPQVVKLPDSLTLVITGIKVNLGANERLVVQMADNHQGSIQASLFW